MALEVEVMYANSILLGALFIALTSILGIFVFLSTKRKTTSPKETRKGGTKNGEYGLRCFKTSCDFLVTRTFVVTVGLNCYVFFLHCYYFVLTDT